MRLSTTAMASRPPSIERINVANQYCTMPSCTKPGLGVGRFESHLRAAALRNMPSSEKLKTPHQAGIDNLKPTSANYDVARRRAVAVCTHAETTMPGFVIVDVPIQVWFPMNDVRRAGYCSRCCGRLCRYKSVVLVSRTDVDCNIHCIYIRIKTKLSTTNS